MSPFVGSGAAWRRPYFFTSRFPFVRKYDPIVCPFIVKQVPLVRIHCQGGHKLQGFTLIELIVTLVIAAILLALAAPNMRTFVSDQRLSTQTNELVADLNFARSEAVTRSVRITVCKSNDVTTCDTNTGTAWTMGRIIFVDADGNGQRATTEELLRVRESLAAAAETGNRILGDASAGQPIRVSYLGNGSVDEITAENQFRVCDDRGAAFGRAVVVSVSGRVRTAERGLDRNGAALTC